MGVLRPTLTLRGLRSRDEAPLAANSTRTPNPMCPPGDTPGPQLNSQRWAASDGYARAMPGVATRAPTYAAPKTLEPPRHFRIALERADFYPINPGCLPVPPFLLQALQKANTIVLVGHTNPDHDTVGGVLTLARALEHLGKTVDICIDDDLSSTQRRLDTTQSIKRAHALRGEIWDLAVAVDVGSTRRIGDAAGLLSLAKSVAVVDHHPGDTDSRTDIVQAYRSSLMSWTDDGYDAAGLQVCGIIEQLFAGKTLDKATWRHMLTPAIAGIATDAQYGTKRDIDPLTPHVFKHLLGRAGLSLHDVESKTTNKAPAALLSAIEDTRGPVRRNAVDGMFMFKVDNAGMKKLIAIAAAADPEYGERDVMALLKSQLSQRLSLGIDCGALLVEGENSRVSISIRSKHDDAQRLAQALGGNGHTNAAAATVRGCSIDEAERRLISVARAKGVVR